MKDLIKTFDNLPLIVKIILAIFADIVIGIYRVVRGIDENKTVAIVVGIVTIFCGAFMWLVDLIYLIVKEGKYLYIA